MDACIATYLGMSVQACMCAYVYVRSAGGIESSWQGSILA